MIPRLQAGPTPLEYTLSNIETLCKNGEFEIVTKILSDPQWKYPGSSKKLPYMEYAAQYIVNLRQEIVELKKKIDGKASLRSFEGPDNDRESNNNIAEEEKSLKDSVQALKNESLLLNSSVESLTEQKSGLNQSVGILLVQHRELNASISALQDSLSFLYSQDKVLQASVSSSSKHQ